MPHFSFYRGRIRWFGFVPVSLAGTGQRERALESLKAVWYLAKPLLSEMMEE
jgi:hypothetical protein